MHLIRPAIDIALRNVTHLLPGHRLVIVEKDSKNDEAYSVAAAIELSQHTDAFFGPVYSYAAAPLLRSHALLWKKPLVTAGAEEHQFANTTEYKQLTTVRLTLMHAVRIFQ